jgi:hypothetical protein
VRHGVARKQKEFLFVVLAFIFEKNGWRQSDVYHWEILRKSKGRGDHVEIRTDPCRVNIDKL